MIDRYNEFIQHKMNHDDALYIIRLMFELNPLGFERYISDYFHREQAYNTKPIWWIDDHWIDIEWSKSFWHKEIYLAVQCKKWYYAHKPVKKDKILEFDYNVKHRKNYKNAHELYFVTTTNASKQAKKVAQEKWIMIRDCRDLLKMKEKYGLDDFKKNTIKWKNNGERLFTNENVIGIIENHLNGKRRIFYPIAH